MAIRSPTGRESRLQLFLAVLSLLLITPSVTGTDQTNRLAVVLLIRDTETLNRNAGPTAGKLEAALGIAFDDFEALSQCKLCPPEESYFVVYRTDDARRQVAPLGIEDQLRAAVAPIADIQQSQNRIEGTRLLSQLGDPDRYEPPLLLARAAVIYAAMDKISALDVHEFVVYVIAGSATRNEKPSAFEALLDFVAAHLLEETLPSPDPALRVLRYTPAPPADLALTHSGLRFEANRLDEPPLELATDGGELLPRSLRITPRPLYRPYRFIRRDHTDQLKEEITRWLFVDEDGIALRAYTPFPGTTIDYEIALQGFLEYPAEGPTLVRLPVLTQHRAAFSIPSNEQDFFRANRLWLLPTGGLLVLAGIIALVRKIKPQERLAVAEMERLVGHWLDKGPTVFCEGNMLVKGSDGTPMPLAQWDGTPCEAAGNRAFDLDLPRLPRVPGVRFEPIVNLRTDCAHVTSTPTHSSGIRFKINVYFNHQWQANEENQEVFVLKIIIMLRYMLEDGSESRVLKREYPLAIALHAVL